MMERIIRSAYDGISFAQPLMCTAEEDRTKQSMKNETDVNRIVAVYKRTGLITPVNQVPGAFLDVSEVGDYREAVTRVGQADALFMQLPAKTRAKFENDPAKFLDFATDSSNEDEMRKLGLLPALPEPPKTVAVEDPPPKVDEGSSD